MGEAVVEVSKQMNFPQDRIFTVLADYRNHHPNIVPRQYFKDLQVLVGGQGAGTQVQVQMRVMGVERDFLMTVAEPEPGRILTETDEQSGTHTSFIIEPLNGDGSRVTISSRFKTGVGLSGWMEKMVTETITRRIYKQELQLLESYLKNFN